MAPVDHPAEFHPQDWIIVVEALAHWAGAPTDRTSGRRGRAYDLIEAIANEQGLPAEELVRQTVRTWPPLRDR